jgi:flagellar L-ring protein FlgH
MTHPNRRAILWTTAALTAWTLGCAARAEDPKPDWALAMRLTADTSARAVGDLLTVVIEEEAEASKAAQSSSSKSSKIGGDISMGHPRIDARPTGWTNAVVPSWSLDAGRSFQGSGSSSNSDKLETKIAARVTEVLPNGNLMIEGRRSMIVQDESVEIVLTGTVRQRDISGDNIVESSRVADASIKYVSNGPLVKNQKMGLITRLWNWINPF